VEHHFVSFTSAAYPGVYDKTRGKISRAQIWASIPGLQIQSETMDLNYPMPSQGL